MAKAPKGSSSGGKGDKKKTPGKIAREEAAQAAKDLVSGAKAANAAHKAIAKTENSLPRRKPAEDEDNGE